MHRWDPRTVLAHLDTNPIKCTYLHYAYTITVALIYNVCERRVIFFDFLSGVRVCVCVECVRQKHTLDWQTTGAMLGSPILPRGRSQLVS